MVFADGLRGSGRPRNPARSLVLVVEVLATENRFEDAFLIPNDQLVLDGKEQHRNRQEPEDARDGDESNPDQKVADVERVSGPGEDPVSDETLYIARAAACHRARRRDAGESYSLAD